MKKLHAIGILLCTLIIFLFQGKMVTSAAEYSYTVRIYTGNQGTITDSADVTVASKNPSQVNIAQDGTKIVITGLSYEDRVTYNAQKAVHMEATSKYYVRGFRLSGRDNGTIAKYASFVVTESQDYVVAYGIKGELTQYTVTFTDGQGNTLAPSQTYYGNVGDQPVMAYNYIEGYAPSARNISRELAADASKNVFEFVYTQRTGEVAPNPPVVNPIAENPTAENPAVNPEGPAAQQANVVNIENANALNPEGVDNPAGEQQEEEINQGADIDEPEVPRASNPDTEITEDKVPLAGRVAENGMLVPIIVGAVAALALIAMLVLLLMKRKKAVAETSEKENAGKE